MPIFMVVGGVWVTTSAASWLLRKVVILKGMVSKSASVERSVELQVRPYEFALNESEYAELMNGPAGELLSVARERVALIGVLDLAAGGSQANAA